MSKLCIGLLIGYGVGFLMGWIVRRTRREPGQIRRDYDCISREEAIEALCAVKMQMLTPAGLRAVLLSQAVQAVERLPMKRE